MNRGCFGPKQVQGIEIPAQGAIEFPCELSIGRAGPFEAKATVYVDDGGVRDLVLTVRGVGEDVKARQ